MFQIQQCSRIKKASKAPVFFIIKQLSTHKFSLRSGPDANISSKNSVNSYVSILFSV